MVNRRIVMVVMVLLLAILAAVISPTFDLLPTALRANHHSNHSVVSMATTPSGLSQSQVVTAVVALPPQRDLGSARIRLDCVRLC